MTYHLITFLGKVPKKKDTNDGYKTITYRFPDETESETSFFGLKLQEYLRPDRLVILGTSGSMWDVFVENFDLKDDLIEERASLIDNAEKDCVDQKQLDKLASLISEKINIPCLLRLIPYGENEKEQITILQEIAKDIVKGDKVAVDVTHGLRHLPMITLISAFYLKSIREVELSGIYYGAFEMRNRGNNDDIVPVLKLDGLLNIASWVSALAAFDKDGDYSIFTDLLISDGLSKDQANLLKKAAFYERNFNISQADQNLKLIKNLPDNGASSLFKEELTRRIEKSQGKNIFERQKNLAEFYLDNNDYVRATIYIFEAFITKQMEKPSFDYHEREAARKAYEKNLSKEYKILRSLRNCLAHGSQPNENIKNILSDQSKLADKLKSLIKELFK